MYTDHTTTKRIALVVLTRAGLALALRLRQGLATDVHIYASPRAFPVGDANQEEEARWDPKRILDCHRWAAAAVNGAARARAVRDGDTTQFFPPPEHQGAWPADAYYGDMDGKWTDNTLSSLIAADPRNRAVQQ